ncbi:MAG: FAD-dependent oxidoreductase [Chlamydiales bacterium]|nr:FAD-dependent oxidoreductase [Chlamydiales bacterium]
MKVLVVGAGIAGLMAARTLHQHGCDVVLHEAADYIGGHARTVQLSFPAELGVFMHEPLSMHPTMYRLAQELGIKIQAFPLTFSFEFANELEWTTVSRARGRLRDTLIFLRTFFRHIRAGKALRNAKYIAGLANFFRDMPERPNYGMSVGEYAKTCSKEFIDFWLIPHMHCWWGIPPSRAMECSIDVILDSMKKVASLEQYIFVDGWNHFLNSIAPPNVVLNQRVEKVVRRDGKVIVDGNEYDHVVLAVPPNISLDLIEATPQERSILGAFSTKATKVFLHRDASWMPQKQKWAAINCLSDDRGETCTFWCGGLFPQKEHVFVTWCDQDAQPKDIIEEGDFLRTLPTVAYTKACREIQQLQGKGGVWYCGAHVHALGSDDVPSLWHENALRSGVQVAEGIMKCKKSTI